MNCKAFIFIITIILFSAEAYAAGDVQKTHHDSVSTMLEKARATLHQNPENALLLITTWHPSHDTIIKIEEAEQIRQIIFLATHLLFRQKKLSSANLKDSPFCKDGVFHNAHHQKVCTIIKNRLHAFEEKPLDKFKKSMPSKSTVNFDTIGISSPPDLYLAKLLHEHSSSPLSEEDWQIVYSHLFSLAGAHDVKYVYEKYQPVIDVLQENFDAFDDSLERPATEAGFFTNNKVQIINKIDSRPLTSIVFGGGVNTLTYLPTAYLVNIMSTEERLAELRGDDNLDAGDLSILQQHTQASHVDMVADMNNPEQLQRIPDKFFEKVYAEHIPVQDYFNPHFFRNAARILKDGGELMIDSYVMNHISKAPYNIVKNAEDIKGLVEYFAKNGFKMTAQNVACDYPLEKGRKKATKRDNAQCFIFKKHIKDKGAEGKDEMVGQAEEGT